MRKVGADSFGCSSLRSKNLTVAGQTGLYGKEDGLNPYDPTIEDDNFEIPVNGKRGHLFLVTKR